MQDSTVTITVTAVDGATKVFEGVGDAAVKNANKAANAWIKANDVSNVSIASAGGSAAATNKAADAHDRLTNSTRRSYFAQTALTTILSAGINKAFLTMVDVTGQAIQRVDLLSNFPAAMSALGLSATDASAAIQKLSGYIAQVGGNMQDATTSVTRFAEVTRDVKAATAEYIGVNNALIAGGAGADVQKNALEQLTQAYSRGLPQLIEWRSLMVAMPAQLNLVGHAMGFVNAQALGEALTNGKVSMQDFMTKLTQMSTGSGPIVAQMYARMNGIQFAFSVFKNTMVQGMTEIIQAIGRQNIISFFSLLTGVIKQLAIWAVQLISILFTLINLVTRIFGGPQLKLAKDNTAGVASNLGAAADNLDNAATGANGLADGLGNAGKAAAKVAGQLAGFDKMNVLQPPPDNSGSGGSGGGGGGSPGAGGVGDISPADASALDGIFGDLSAKMQEISTAAKVLAGIIAGLAAIKFAQGILNQFNGMIQTIKDTQKNLKDLKKALFGATDESGKKVDGLAQKIGKLGSGAKSVGSNISSGLAGVLGGLSTRIGPLLAPIGAAVSGLFTDIVLSIAVGLGVSVGAAIAIVVGAVLLIVAAVILIWLNWKKIWGWMKKAADDVWSWLKTAAKTVAKAVTDAWNGVVDFFKKLWDGIKNTASTVFTDIKNAVIGFFTAVANNPVVKVFEDIFKFIFQLVMALVQIAFVLLVDAFLLVVAGLGWLGQQFLKVWNDIVAIFGAVGKWFGDRFKEAWDAIVAIWNKVSQWFDTNVWQPVVAIFSAVGKWFGDQFQKAWDAIVAVWNAVANWFNVNVWQPIVTFFTPAVKWFGDLFSNAWQGIKNIWNAVSGWFGDVWQGIKNIWNEVSGFFGNIFTNAWQAIKDAFGHVKDFLSGLWDGISSGLRSAMQTAINVVYSGMNDVAGFVNRIISDINNLSGKVHGPTISFHMGPYNAPKLAQGGIVKQATLATVGEAGAEAIVPLENNLEWIDKLASKINGGGGQPVQLTVQIGEEKIVSKVIELINEKTQMSGRNSILV